MDCRTRLGDRFALGEQHDGEHRAERVRSEGEIKFAHESLLITPALTPTQDARWKEGWGIEFGYKMGACIELVSDSSKVGRFTKATTKSSTGDAVRPADVSFATTTGILNPF